MYFPASTPGERLLTAAAYIASVRGFEDATLAAAAVEADIPLDVATALYPSADTFRDSLGDYLAGRLAAFVSPRTDVKHVERLVTITHGLVNFAEADRHAFNALLQQPLPPDTIHPVQLLIDEATTNCDQITCPVKRASFLALSIGFAHLTAFGRVRLLLPAARHQLLRGVENIIRAIYLTNTPIEVLPVRTSFEPDMEKTNDALFRAAINEFKRLGPDGLTFHNAVRSAGLPSRTLTLYDGDAAFIHALEDYIDDNLKASLLGEIDALPSDATAMERLMATSVGYVKYALRDPQSLCALLYIATGSILPTSGNEDRDDAALDVLTDAVSDAISELGGSDSQWTLFEYAIASWAFGHGAAFLLAMSFLDHLNAEERWEFLSNAIGCAAIGLTETAQQG